MPKRIILVRHGETDYNKQEIMQGHLDVFLNPLGLKQARDVAKKLKNEKVDIIYSSDLKRTFQTAQVIAKELDKNIIISEFIRERYFGYLEGRTKPEAKKLHTHFSWERGFADPVSQYFNIETNDQIDSRVNKFLSKLKKSHKNQTVLAVVHGGIIWSLMRVFKIESFENHVDNLFKNTVIVYFEKYKDTYILKKLSNEDKEILY